MYQLPICSFKNIIEQRTLYVYFKTHSNLEIGKLNISKRLLLTFHNYLQILVIFQRQVLQ